MDNLLALKSLKGMVEADVRNVQQIVPAAKLAGLSPSLVMASINSKHDAAFTLLGKCLGDRWLAAKIKYDLGLQMWQVKLCEVVEFFTGKHIHTSHASLPTAILLAVIEALIFELENEDG